MSEDRLVRPAPISGFPEWLPEVRAVELQWLDRIRAAFERYGFVSIETPAAEALDVLMAKGETSQEVYALRRVAGGDDADARLGLHFDLTVPFARYVAQHFNELDFPFKRYQIQKVWRGERPQEGRFREFTQCDLDVINIDSVPLHFDAELPRVVHEILTELAVGPFCLGINNRKVLQGCYAALGVPDPLAVIRAADKLDKIGAEGVRKLLLDGGLTAAQAASVLDLAALRGSDPSIVDDVARLVGPTTSDLLKTGLDELGYVLDELRDLPAGSVQADLSIARGLDYYTGTVYEGRLLDFPGYGSICSGGRYENLAGSFIRRDLPGIGLSIGLTRLFAKLLAEGLVQTGPKTPTQVLVAVPSDERRALALETAGQLRSRGLNVEAHHQADRVGKQIRYASRRGIPFVWFPPFEDGKPHEVKNLATGDQVAADPQTWHPCGWR